MDIASREKVSVVVIHGVGETKPGWIDDYLVPELEKWRAFENIRKPDTATAKTSKDTSNTFVFVAHASDRPLAIVLEDDAVFEAFCDAAYLKSLHEQFKTAKLRSENRDELVSHIAHAVSNKTANEWLRDLQARGVPCTVAFEPESVLRRVRDPEDGPVTSTWSSFTRHWPLEARDVRVTELYWADLSRVGYTITDRFAAVLQLFLEAPDVLGRTFLSDCRQGLSRIVRKLMLAAIWVMRWPISGLHTAIFAAAFAAIVLQLTKNEAWLPQTIAGALAFVAVAGYHTSRKFLHGKIGLSDLGLSASVHAVLLLGLLALASRTALPATLAAPESYLTIAVAIVLIAWLCWTLLIAMAIAVLALLAVQKLVWRLLLNRSVAPPIARPAAAIGISILTGNFWKFLLALLGLFVITTLVTSSAKPACSAGELQSLKTVVGVAPIQLSPGCMLSFSKDQLKDVVALNGVALALIALACSLVVLTRTAGKTILPARFGQGKWKLPRLIASPLIILTLFATALTNAWVFYIRGFFTGFGDAGVRHHVGDFFRSGGLEELGTGALGLIVFYFFIVSLIEKSNGVIHIGRDLVDHQYDPKELSLAMWIDSGVSRIKSFFLDPRDDKTGEQSAAEPPERVRFRRRQRIQRRLESLIDEVIATESTDRLIFLAHSQGTVILYDYLTNHDGLISSGHEEALNQPLATTIDLLTLGSPLQHIYRYYYPGYDLSGLAQPEEHPPLMSKVRSWTNMWRIDDPIGGDVNLHDGIENMSIGRGGHTNYWMESAVCQKIWELINEQGATQSVSQTVAHVAA